MLPNDTFILSQYSYKSNGEYTYNTKTYVFIHNDLGFDNLFL